eukprot:230256_1
MAFIRRTTQYFNHNLFQRSSCYLFSSSTTKKNLFQMDDIVPIVKGNKVMPVIVKQIKDDKILVENEWIDMYSNALNPNEMLKYWDQTLLFKLTIKSTTNCVWMSPINWNIHEDEVNLLKGFITCRPTTQFNDDDIVIKTRKFLEDYNDKLNKAGDIEWFDLSSTSFKLLKNDNTEVIGMGCVFAQDTLVRWLELCWSPIHCIKAYIETQKNPYIVFKTLCRNAFGVYDKLYLYSDNQDKQTIDQMLSK